jgi:hypothetical protein
MLMKEGANGNRSTLIHADRLTDDVNSILRPSNDLFPAQLITAGERSPIAGPTIEWQLTPGLSVQADGIFRELRYSSSLAGTHNPTVTWEFPILAKYRLTLGL